MENNYEAYHYAALILKHLKGELSVIEEIKLTDWLKQHPDNARLLQDLKNEGLVQSDLDFLSSISNKDAWNNIVSRTQNPSFVHQVYLLIQKWKYAAIILIACLAGGVFYKFSPRSLPMQQKTAVKYRRYKNDVPPGGTKAKLTLADGSVVLMDGHSNGMIKKYNGLKITSQNGMISYQGANRSNNPNSFNMISTPKGGKYKVILPDGSLVWLNSASSLKFPVAFSGHERRVYLTGEGYFEVAKNKHKPFKVFANNSVVQVLGTHFNVKAYNNEDALETTLLEGSVKVYSGKRSKMIIPGQQASIDAASARIKVYAIDVKETVAWKDDLFIFDREDIESVMREISRWYDVDVEYQDTLPELHFSGSISRTKDLSQILNMLELTGGVRFGIDGRRVIVTR